MVSFRLDFTFLLIGWLRRGVGGDVVPWLWVKDGIGDWETGLISKGTNHNRRIE